MTTPRKPRVLLLNPPGAEAYSRDKFCTSISQANYGWPPIDLLVFSGQLRDGFEVSVLDAIAERLGHAAALKRVQESSPDHIIALTSAASWPEDFAFLRQAKTLTGAQLMVGGDIMLAKGEWALKRFPFLDALYLNYTTGNVVQWLHGTREDAIPNILCRNDNQIVVGEKFQSTSFSCGVPQHELFPINRYRFPFCRTSRYSSVITSFGCPWKCAFCVPGTFDLSLRAVEEVIEELRYLKRMGVHEILFQDSTLNANREHSRALFEAIRTSDLHIQWMCQSRADCVNDEILGEMRASGCHTIQFGVESGNDEVREKANKRCSTAQYEETFALCRKHGIRPSGFFIIGLPGETEETVQQTIDLAKRLRCSTAVFGLAMPHPVTTLGDVTGSKQADLSEMDHYDNHQRIGFQLSELTGEQIVRWRLKAYASFYLRASYVWQRLTEIGSPYEFGDTIRNGIHLVRENLAARGLKRSKREVLGDALERPTHQVSLKGRNRTVVVVGGGVLGMTAAYQLASNGAQVHLIEKEPYLGGLSAPAQIAPDRWIDQHHHFVAGTDFCLFGLLEELGLSESLRWRDTTTSYFTGGRLVPFTTAFDLLRFPGLSVAEKFRFALSVRKLQRHKEWESLESIPVEDWYRRECGDRLYDVLWKHMMDCKFGDAAHEVPLSWMWARLTRRIATRRLGKGTEHFGRLVGGTKPFLDTLENSIRAMGTIIHKGCSATKIVLEGGRLIALETDQGRIECDSAIVTIPNPSFLALFDQWHKDYAESLGRIRYQGIVSIVVETTDRVSPSFWVNIGDDSLPVPGVIDIGYLEQPDCGSLLYIPHYVSHESDYYKTPDGLLAERAQQWLSQIFPKFKNTSVSSINVFRAPYADPLYEIGYSKVLPPHETPIEGLFLYNTTQIYPVTRSMNNSIRFGVQAAKAVLEQVRPI